MNTIDFSMLKPVATLAVLLLTAPPVFANEPPPPESFNQRSELILTLSDEALPAVDNLHTDHVRNRAANRQSDAKNDKRPVNIGCGMDVSPFGNDSNSLGNRLVGECNLHYRY